MAKTCGRCAPDKAHHSDEVKSSLDKRLARIEGQIKGLRRMVEQDVYCDDVLNQVTSVMAALNGVRLALLEKHVETCVTDQLREGREDVIPELMKTISRMTKQ